MRKEVWGFQENVIIFLDEELIGGLEDFLKWALDNHGYKDFRSGTTSTLCCRKNVLLLVLLAVPPFVA